MKTIILRSMWIQAATSGNIRTSTRADQRKLRRETTKISLFQEKCRAINMSRLPKRPK